MTLRNLKQTFSELILKHSEELADAMFDELFSLYRGRFTEDEIKAGTVHLYIQLIEIIARGLVDDCVQEEAPAWGEKVGELSINNGGELGGTIKSSNLYKKVIWSFLLKQGESQKISYVEMNDILSEVDAIITLTIYGFTNAFTKHTEKELKEKENLYLKVSVPLVPISSNVAILPLIGEITDVRSEVLLQETLHACTSKRYENLILDVSGIYSINSLVIATLSKLIDCLNLLGVDVMVTGIRKELSLSFIEHGVFLRGVRIYSNLSNAIQDL
ncbi:rsbT co-antagonist protein RsbR [Peribacillus deserti]|uniref:RsbT co-antagonist protein RsbR n=1 Tax=Peribacillus deserti TaxID=673318 RepID=A0ABS2QDQ4_9BACI|nr:STAS domain-containing protein [Peribacillus deserti]MBM7691269.1 rsbT co-antagonist protein RsbR [Peribacillus deserti]